MTILSKRSIIISVREYRFVRRSRNPSDYLAGWRVSDKQFQSYADRVRVARSIAGAPRDFDAGEFRRIYPDSRCTVLLVRDVSVAGEAQS